MSGDSDIPTEWRDTEIRRLLGALADFGVKVDAVLPDGTHLYWSTHCRHGRHDDCSATVIHRGGGEVSKRPAQCKTCAAPCRDLHHSDP